MEAELAKQIDQEDVIFGEDDLESEAVRMHAENMLEECSVRLGDDLATDEIEDPITTVEAQLETDELTARARERQILEHVISCGGDVAVDPRSIDEFIESGMLPEDAALEAALNTEDVLGNTVGSAPLDSAADVAVADASRLEMATGSLCRCVVEWSGVLLVSYQPSAGATHR